MTLGHLLIAAAAVAAWFIGWGWMVARTGLGTARGRPADDAIESAFLTMFAALWFASLGHGGWWVLFGVVAVLIEGPVRRRHRTGIPATTGAWREAVLGVARMMGAGALLSILL